MKALVLAAGLGTRLRPYTHYLPKPLFTIGGRALMDIIICKLQEAGCTAITINTHHLASQIESFIADQRYAIPVHAHYEPVILGTGGAIKNLENFWDDQPFFVVNSDIVTDIDFRFVYDFHLSHGYPATLVLQDYPEINTVSVDSKGFVIGFPADSQANIALQSTFTGIQVIHPEVLNFIPAAGFSSSIETYKTLIMRGRKIKALVLNGSFWSDIGTPERYQSIAYRRMALQAFQSAFPDHPIQEIKRSRIAGDGSDRTWYRLTSHLHGQAILMVDHGIKAHPGVSEADSFVSIGRHLHRKGVPVPQIYHSDPFSGLVFLEDLGDIHLQSTVWASADILYTDTAYRKIIDLLIDMSLSGGQGFDPNWTYQTPEYDKTMILEKECRYFLEAFLNGYMRSTHRYEKYENEFHKLADNTVGLAIKGFMHRDFQSRNIMVNAGQFYFIDFQGGRLGPIQYDLASLLIDPYVALPPSLQDRLLDYCAVLYESKTGIPKETLIKGYRYCAITRNLQILGAFGFLSRVKKKGSFARYIPKALETLKRNLRHFPHEEFPNLTRLVEGLDVSE